MNKNAKILIVGDKILPGKGLIAFLQKQGLTNVFSETNTGLDLLSQKSVTAFFLKEQPEYVFLGYIKAGGIAANMKYPADFIYENVEAQNNIIRAGVKNKVKILLFYGSSCAYPKKCPQPIREEYLLEGALEKTSQPYAISKIAGIEMCRSFRQQYGTDFFSLIPATIYGPGDDFNLENGHVISSLIKRFHEAKIEKKKEIEVWGSGKPRREFIYIDDLCRASVFLMNNDFNINLINVGFGNDISIKKLAYLVKKIVGFKGKIIFNTSKPDGVLRKILDSSKINDIGWKPEFDLERGLKLTYEWYQKENNI